MVATGSSGPTLTEDLDDLYENAPCGYLSLQPDGRIVKVNRTLALWLDVPAEELLGKRLRDLLNMAGRIFYETHFAPLLRMQGFFNEVALDLITANGAKLPVLANALERRDDEDRLMFTRITLFQAVERRRYERELVDARVASDAAGAAIRSELDVERHNAELREQFIAILGHDLRNPLASMNAAVRLLRKEIQSLKGEGILDLMQGSVSRMSGLIDNVLDFARVRLGSGLVLSRQAQSLEPVVRHVLDELRTAHPDRTMELSFRVDEDIDFDASRMAQLTSNLVANALTHGKPEEPVDCLRLFLTTIWNCGLQTVASRFRQMHSSVYSSHFSGVNVTGARRAWALDSISPQRSRGHMVAYWSSHLTTGRPVSPSRCPSIEKIQIVEQWCAVT